MTNEEFKTCFEKSKKVDKCWIEFFKEDGNLITINKGRVLAIEHYCFIENQKSGYTKIILNEGTEIIVKESYKKVKEKITNND